MATTILNSLTNCFTVFSGIPTKVTGSYSFDLSSSLAGCSTDKHNEPSLKKYQNSTVTVIDTQPKPVLPNILHHIGSTPMVKLNRIPEKFELECELLAKCEYFNPGGSIKDRVVERMISDAESSGKIKPGDTLIEATSGNTGIGLALAGAVKGYNVIIVMPSTMSNEKSDIIKSLGATVVKTSPEENFVEVAKKIALTTPRSYLMEQFSNSSNPQTHYEITANEILNQCEGKIDMIVCAAGTGGTVTGIGKKLKEKLPNCKIICVDPDKSNISPINSERKKDDKIQQLEGIGGKYKPDVLDENVVDKWIKVPDKESFLMSRLLIKNEGLLCGGSSGAIALGAIIAAKEYKLSANSRVVIILPDGIRNYMSKFMSSEWMESNGYHDNQINLQTVMDLACKDVTTETISTSIETTQG